MKQGNAQGGSQTADNILQTPATGIGTSSMHGTQVAIKPEKSPPEAERKEVMVVTILSPNIIMFVICISATIGADANCGSSHSKGN